MNGLVWFAQNRHRLTKAQQANGDDKLLAAERLVWLNLWMVDVLILADSGRLNDAYALWLKGPREVRMDDSNYVAYARNRHSAVPVVQRGMDFLFEISESLNDLRLLAFETTKQSLLRKLSAWWAQIPPPITEGRHHA